MERGKKPRVEVDEDVEEANELEEAIATLGKALGDEAGQKVECVWQDSKD